MGELSKESIEIMLNNEREKLLREVKERVSQKKSMMETEQITDYDFFKRRKSVDY